MRHAVAVSDFVPGERGPQKTGTAWLVAAISTLVLAAVLIAVGYSQGPRSLGTIGIACLVAPVLLGLRWSRERGR